MRFLAPCPSGVLTLPERTSANQAMRKHGLLTYHIEHIKKPNRISSDWAGITLDIFGVYLTGLRFVFRHSFIGEML